MACHIKHYGIEINSILFNVLCHTIIKEMSYVLAAVVLPLSQSGNYLIILICDIFN
jgi:hypothetical protein